MIHIIEAQPQASVACLGAILRRDPYSGCVRPAFGYGIAQIKALGGTINARQAEVAIAATPLDLAEQVRTNKPVIHARYEFAETGEPTAIAVVDRILATHCGEPTARVE